MESLVSLWCNLRSDVSSFLVVQVLGRTIVIHDRVRGLPPRVLVLVGKRVEVEENEGKERKGMKTNRKRIKEN
ncbi:hypothetical protein M0802_015096 [Mischocyttarus mexicanus]|nr:hypothetical protein M0802_015096 [Mischocyttarus mexicanus]